MGRFKTRSLKHHLKNENAGGLESNESRNEQNYHLNEIKIAFYFIA